MAGSILVSGPIEQKGTKNRLIQSALDGNSDGIIKFTGTYSSITITCDVRGPYIPIPLTTGWYKWGILACGTSPLIPEFGIPVSTANGFTVQITNYSGAFSWSGTATNSVLVAISSTGLVTVTNLAAGTNSIVTIITDAAVDGSAQVRGTSLFAALTPTFGPTTRTSDGFTAQITNYDANYTWAGTATASGTVVISATGLVTVTGVTAGTSSTATITTTKANTVSGSALVTETSSLAAALTPIFGMITTTGELMEDTQEI